jgi:ribosomal protein S18 acetylase RimI-like enzyme
VSLRLARPGETGEVGRLLGLSGVDSEPDVAQAIEDRSMSSGLIRALDAGHRGFLHRLVENPAQAEEVPPALSMVLVAETPAHEVVGAMLAMPPFEFLAHMTMAGVPFPVALSYAIHIVKLCSLGIDEKARNAGIGSALVTYCTDIYFELGYGLAFGQIRQRSGLETYYSRLGFEVLPAGQGVPLHRVGLPVSIEPLPGERLITRWCSDSEVLRAGRPAPASPNYRHPAFGRLIPAVSRPGRPELGRGWALPFRLPRAFDADRRDVVHNRIISQTGLVEHYGLRPRAGGELPVGSGT